MPNRAYLPVSHSCLQIPATWHTLVDQDDTGPWVVGPMGLGDEPANQMDAPGLLNWRAGARVRTMGEKGCGSISPAWLELPGSPPPPSHLTFLRV